MDKGGFIVPRKREDIYVDTTGDLKTKLDSSNYKVERPLPREKIQKSYWINEI